jgi:hypothetical protein
MCSPKYPRSGTDPQRLQLYKAVYEEKKKDAAANLVHGRAIYRLQTYGIREVINHQGTLALGWFRKVANLTSLVPVERATGNFTIFKGPHGVVIWIIGFDSVWSWEGGEQKKY